MRTRLLKQRGGTLPLECQRRALGIVLVVSPGRARGLGEVAEFALQRRNPLGGALPLAEQQVPDACHLPELRSGHPEPLKPGARGTFQGLL